MDALRQDYQNLVEQRQQAKRAYDIEASEKGEQFRVQDEAKIPTVPFKPKPMQVLLLAVCAGLAIGGGVVFVLEIADQTIRNENEFMDGFPELPLLVAIPKIPAKTGSPGSKGGGKRVA